MFKQAFYVLNMREAVIIPNLLSQTKNVTWGKFVYNQDLATLNPAYFSTRHIHNKGSKVIINFCKRFVFHMQNFDHSSS